MYVILQDLFIIPLGLKKHELPQVFKCLSYTNTCTNK
jgi:hypothetical protein